MSYEKSCGAVIYRNNGKEIEYLLVFNKKAGAKGHWGFPKGHMEFDEDEYQTAAREIFEETGLMVVFCGGNREVSTYSPKEGVTKDAVYFLATPRAKSDITLQKSEIEDFCWCSKDKALEKLTYDAEILRNLTKEM